MRPAITVPAVEFQRAMDSAPGRVPVAGMELPLLIKILQEFDGETRFLESLLKSFISVKQLMIVGAWPAPARLRPVPVLRVGVKAVGDRGAHVPAGLQEAEAGPGRFESLGFGEMLPDVLGKDRLGRML